MVAATAYARRFRHRFPQSLRKGYIGIEKPVLPRETYQIPGQRGVAGFIPPYLPPKSANVDPLTAQWLTSLSAFPNDIHPGVGSLTYTQLRSMAAVPYVASIIMTRMNQASDFAFPQPDPYSLGFVVVPDRKGAILTRQDNIAIGEITDMLLTGGAHYFPGGFESALRAIVQDTLTVDQVNVEPLMNHMTQKPWGFCPVDPATIRRAIPDRKALADYRWDPAETAYVQVINNRVVREFTRHDISWWIRNQEDKIYRFGYGAPELEKAVTIVTALINAIIHNSVNYTTGIHGQNLIELGLIGGDERLTSAERQISSATSGVRNNRRTVLIQTNPNLQEQIKVHSLGFPNKEMEFSEWINFLKKQLCFLPGERVAMADGTLKAIETVQPGEGVISHSGRTRAVVNTQTRMFDGDIITIQAGGGKVVRATDEHPFLVASSHVDGKMKRVFSDPEWVTAGEIVEGRDYLVVPKPKLDKAGTTTDCIDLGDYVNTETNHIGADFIKPRSNRSNRINRYIPLNESTGYALGLYMAEGCGCRTGSALQFSFGSGYEEDTYALAAAEFLRGVGLKPRVDYKHNATNVVAASKPLNEAFCKLFGGLATVKQVPAEIRTASVAVQRAFLSGYIAGDGSCWEANQAINLSLATASRDAADQTQYMLLKQGVYAGVHVCNAKSRSGHTLYQVRVSGSQLKDLSSWLTGPKGDKLRGLITSRPGPNPTATKVYSTPAYFLVPVYGTWREHYSGPVHNMEVDADHTYCVERFAVHNCSLFQMDPAEQGDIFGNEGQKQQMNQTSPSDRIFASKERGLRPLMRRIARWLNDFLIAPYWPGYKLVFVGFDAQSEERKLDLDLKAATTFLSPNELRIERGLQPFDDPVSKRPLNALYTAYIQSELDSQFTYGGIEDDPEQFLR